jgi:heme exporter protein B
MSDTTASAAAPTAAARSGSYLGGALRIAGKDLRLEMRRLSGLTAMLVLAIAIVMAFAFCFGIPTMKRLGPERLVPAVLWISLLFSSLSGLRGAFASEREHETLTALVLCPVDPSAIYLGKLLSNLVLVGALEVILLPLTAVLFGWDLLPALPGVALVVFLHTLGFVALGTLFSAMVTRLRQGEALLAILMIPCRCRSSSAPARRPRSRSPRRRSPKCGSGSGSPPSSTRSRWRDRCCSSVRWSRSDGDGERCFEYRGRSGDEDTGPDTGYANHRTSMIATTTTNARGFPR